MELKEIDEFLKFMADVLNEKDLLCFASVNGSTTFYPSSNCLPQEISIDYLNAVIKKLSKRGYPILKVIFEKENKVLIVFKYRDRAILIVTRRGPSEISILARIKSLLYGGGFFRGN